MNLKDLLGDKYHDEMTVEDISKALADMQFVSQSAFDKKINEISQANRKEAVETLKKDPAFIESMKKQFLKDIEEEAKLNAEEKAKKILAEAEAIARETHKKENIMNAKAKFIEAQLGEDEYSTILPFLVSEDAEVSAQNVDNFIASYKKGLDARLQREKDAILQLQRDPLQGQESNGGKLSAAAQAAQQASGVANKGGVTFFDK